MIRTAYRIIKRRYADTIWTGFGAREFGGRWNSRGVAVIYTAENRSLAAMELLVHLVKPRILRGYVIASITFDDANIDRLEVETLPRRWDRPVAPRSLRAYGDNWIEARKRPVLAVPSALMPGECNYLIDPAHPKFKTFKKSEPEVFIYDTRLA